MSDLRFSPSEMRSATAALASVAALAPILYMLWPKPRQISTEHIKTFNKLLDGYSTLRPEALIANTSHGFTHTVLPASLNLPVRNLPSFKQHSTTVFSLFADFQMIPQPNEIGEAVHCSLDTNTVIAQCKLGGRLSAESEMGRKLIDSGLEEWWSECVLLVKMSNDGKSIVQIREFVDSGKAEELERRLSGVLSD